MHHTYNLYQCNGPVLAKPPMVVHSLTHECNAKAHCNAPMQRAIATHHCNAPLQRTIATHQCNAPMQCSAPVQRMTCCLLHHHITTTYRRPQRASSLPVLLCPKSRIIQAMFLICTPAVTITVREVRDASAGERGDTSHVISWIVR